MLDKFEPKLGNESNIMFNDIFEWPDLKDGGYRPWCCSGLILFTGMADKYKFLWKLIKIIEIPSLSPELTENPKIFSKFR